MTATTVVTGSETEQDPPPARRGRLRHLLVVGGVLIVCAAVAGGTFLFRGDTAGASTQDGEVVDLEPLTTTLGAEPGLRHARVSMAVVLADGVEPGVVDERSAMLQDALLGEVARMTADDVRSAAGSEELRRRLSTDAKRIWGPEVVRRVLLTELLVQ